MGMLHPYSVGARALGIVLRTAHVAAMAVLVGGTHFSAPDPALRTWQVLAVLTGVALLGTELSHGRHWAYQGRGLMTIAHVAALALLASSGMSRAGTAAALVIGAIGSHMPRAARKWSLRHGRVLE